MIQLVVGDKRVKFDANLEVVSRLKIKPNSKLLALVARRGIARSGGELT